MILQVSKEAELGECIKSESSGGVMTMMNEIASVIVEIEQTPRLQNRTLKAWMMKPLSSLGSRLR